MSDKKKDVRCILLCKSFKANDGAYDELYQALLYKDAGKKDESLEQYLALGEHDRLFSYQISLNTTDADNTLLCAVRENNEKLAMLLSATRDNSTTLAKLLNLVRHGDAEKNQEHIDQLNELSKPIFFRPLYAVRNYSVGSAVDTKICEFWGEPMRMKPFFFASIVHLTGCGIVHKEKELILNQVIEPLLFEIKDKGRALDGTSTLDYLIYYSLDLSDYIILWKANSPKPVLEALESLYQRTGLLGSTNTICALPKEQLNRYKDKPELFDSVFPQEHKDNFAMTIRAVTCNYYDVAKVHSQLTAAMADKYEVHEASYFTFGNDDYLGMFPKVKASALYALFTHIKYEQVRKAVSAINTTLAIESFKGHLSKEEEMRTQIRAVCDNMHQWVKELRENKGDEYTNCAWKTQVFSLGEEIERVRVAVKTSGIEFPVVSRSELKEVLVGKKCKDMNIVCNKMERTNLLLKAACVDLADRFKRLLVEQSDSLFCECTWRKPVLELMNLLTSMSSSTIFDNVCFLIIDSAHEFYSWLWHYMKEKPEYKNDDKRKHFLNEMEQKIECFVREWDSLADHVVRGDGTVRQTPGYEPLIYNMCTSAVEYSNAYAQKIVQYLNAFDCGQTRETQCASFVAPKLCRRFKTAQFFHDKRGGDSLILITIPISSILDPFLIMTSLTHEVSHYCSNDIRLRKERPAYYIKCIAYIICMYLDVNTSNTLKVCTNLLGNNYNEHATEYLADCDKQEQPKHDKYLNKVTYLIEKSVYSMLGDPEQLKKIHRAFWEDPSRTDGWSAQEIANQMNAKLHFAFADLSYSHTGDQVSMKTHISDIDYFMKECYADFLMVYILNLCKNDYLRAVFGNMLRLAKEANDQVAGARAQAFQRAFIIASLFDDEYEFWNTGVERGHKSTDAFWECKFKSLVTEFDNTYRAWKERKASSVHSASLDNSFYEPMVLEFIISYLKKCRDVIKERETLEENKIRNLRGELRSAFEVIIDQDDIFDDQYQAIVQANRETILKRFEDKDKVFQFQGE